MTKTLIKTINSSLIKLPSPINISYWWNFGSLLGLFLIIQLISGIMLSFHYCPNIALSFNSIIHITQNVNHGWLLHNIHINGASMFFICMYIHMGRGIYYHSSALSSTWMVGTSIFILSMATAFLGYVLPWGQMSYWGATVITNLITAIPFIGLTITEWIWGGGSINNATLNRFFSLHFLLPFIIIIMIMLHLFFLHKSGSNNPLGINSNLNKIPFHIYFTMKDMLGYLVFLLFFMTVNLQYSYMFSDPDNFIQANPLVTPAHIQPEWYFLFAYAILRSIPNKLGGILALLASILILYTLTFNTYNMNSNSFYPLNQMLFWIYSNNFILLTYMGTQPIEFPFMDMSQLLSLNYFSFFFFSHYSLKLWDLMLFNNKI